MVTVSCPACGRRFSVPADDWRLPLHLIQEGGTGPTCSGRFGVRPPATPRT
jgi:hypothetical protein